MPISTRLELVTRPAVTEAVLILQTAEGHVIVVHRLQPSHPPLSALRSLHNITNTKDAKIKINFDMSPKMYWSDAP